MKTYRINEIFYSIQGEGVRAGTAAVFLRFAGCNLKCTKQTAGFDCDTDHQDYRDLTAQQILDEVRAVVWRCEWIVMTGGEPLLQVDQELITALRDYLLALETNGTIQVPDGFDWIAVSPKHGQMLQMGRRVSEVRVVLPAGQIPLNYRGHVRSGHFCVSPVFNGAEVDRASLETCIQFVKDNPVWRLSVQQHKGWSVR